MGTSDPAQLTVLAPGPNHDQHEHDGFSLSAGVSGSTPSLNVPTTPGLQYAVEYRANLTTGDWTILQSFEGDGLVKLITDSVTNEARRFYRAILQP